MNENNDTFKYYKEKLKQLISTCVKLKKDGFILSSGKKSSFYIDCKKELLTPECCEYVAMCIRHIPGLSHTHSYSTVAGVTSGADPIIIGCVAHNKNNGLFIRNKNKEYGTKKLIEGKIPVLDPRILVVDDVLTTGNSLKYATKVLQDTGLEIVGTVIIVDRQENNAREIIKNYTGKPVWSLLTKKELTNG